MMTINHAERAHAILSPSASHRWINCTMSVPLCENYEDKGSAYAEEGTMAHELAEWHLRQATGLPVQGEKPTSDNPDFDLFAMDQHGYDYATYVCQQRTSATDTIGVEIRVELRDVILDVPTQWLCFGTADCVMLTDEGETLHIIDYKYGKGVEVSAEHNSQLMLYALMALSSAMSPEQAKVVKNIKLRIYQPRINNISEWMIRKSDLLGWYSLEVQPKIMQILSQRYDMKAGEHCRWCKHRSFCRVYDLTYLDPTIRAMRLEDNTITKERIVEVLSVKDELIKWLNELGDRVLSEMLQGETYDGYKVVEGRSVRKITDESGAIAYLRSHGYKESDFFKPLELQNITTISKLVGKKTFDTEMAPYVTKPKGKPTLAPASDKREVYVAEENDANNVDVFDDEA